MLKSNQSFTINYSPLPTFKLFHKSKSLVRGIMGPLGSGKTTGCCFELLRLMLNHTPNKQCIRKSRILIVRNTYRELTDTTLRTWLSIFKPEIFGNFHKTNLIHSIRIKDVHCDVLFRALDKEKDLAKLLSLEVSFIFVNEARQIPFEIIQMLPRRLRYPHASKYPPHFKGIIMDTNPPDVDHWWYRLFEDQKLENWQIFKQPSGISQKAENLANLPQGYYSAQMQGMDENWLKVYRDGQYGFVKTGLAVYPEYKDWIHCQNLKPNPNMPLVVGLDFGRTPAAVFCQIQANQDFWVLDELTTFDTGAIEFASLIKTKLENDFKGFDVEFFGDPSGNQKSQTDSKSVFTTLAAGGVLALPAPTNNQHLRKEVLRQLLNEKVNPISAFKIDPKCKTLRKGLLGGYSYPKLNITSQNRYSLKPEKNKYSHPVEALEYALLGVGKADTINHLALKNYSTLKNWPSSLQIDDNWQVLDS